MCDCNRLLLQEKNVEYQYFNFFDSCLCQEDHKIFAAECENCCYNIFSFFRQYFFSIKCCCWSLNNNATHNHCQNLLQALNYYTRKVCLKSKDVPNKLKLEKIDKYLQSVKGPTILFLFWKQKFNSMSVDSLEWADFFHDKKTVIYIYFKHPAS